MCCGKPRLNGQARPAPVPAPPIRPPINRPAQVAAVFQYSGQTALTLASPITGRVYRFTEPGARLAVDPRDRSWVSFVSNLARMPT